MADPGLLRVPEWRPDRNNSRNMHRSCSSSGGRSFSSSTRRSPHFSSNVRRSSFSSSVRHSRPLSRSGHRRFSSSGHRRQKHFAESLGRRLAIETMVAEASGVLSMTGRDRISYQNV